jgi:hypothetical protein
MEKALQDGVWTVVRTEEQGGDVLCDSEPAADALIAALGTPGRYRFTVEAAIGPEDEGSRVIGVEAA